MESNTEGSGDAQRARTETTSQRVPPLDMSQVQQTQQDLATPPRGIQPALTTDDRLKIFTSYRWGASVPEVWVQEEFIPALRQLIPHCRIVLDTDVESTRDQAMGSIDEWMADECLNDDVVLVIASPEYNEATKRDGEGGVHTEYPYILSRFRTSRKPVLVILRDDMPLEESVPEALKARLLIFKVSKDYDDTWRTLAIRLGNLVGQGPFPTGALEPRHQGVSTPRGVELVRARTQAERTITCWTILPHDITVGARLLRERVEELNQSGSWPDAHNCAVAVRDASELTPHELTDRLCDSDDDLVLGCIANSFYQQHAEGSDAERTSYQRWIEALFIARVEHSRVGDQVKISWLQRSVLRGDPLRDEDDEIAAFETNADPNWLPFLTQVQDNEERFVQEGLDALNHIREAGARHREHAGSDTNGEMIDTTEREQTMGYLNWLIRTHRELKLPSLSPSSGSGTVPSARVELERVYIALRAMPTKPNRAQELERELMEELLSSQASDKDIIEHVNARPLDRAVVGGSGAEQLSVRPGGVYAEGADDELTLSVGEVIQRYRVVVVLGGPGSGKTTLAEWLAVRSAQQLLKSVDQVLVPAHEVDPFQRPPPPGAPVALAALGPARVPILVQIRSWVHDLKTGSEKAKDKDLFEYMCEYPLWNQQSPSFGPESLYQSGERVQTKDILRAALRENRALVIVDGYDEVPEQRMRQTIKQHLEDFIAKFIDGKNDPGTPPVTSGGNQMIITSRIAAYEMFRLDGTSVRHMLVTPMSLPVIERFCDTWMAASATSQDDATRKATILKRAIRANPETIALASNPLLVTVMAMMVKGSETANVVIPTQRSVLCKSAIGYLVEIWTERLREAGKNPPLSTEDMWIVLRRIAYWIQDDRRSTGKGIGEEALKSVVKLALEELKYDEVDARHKARELCGYLRREVGIICEVTPQLFGFLHSSFQEFLAGWYILQSSDDPREVAQNLVTRIEDSFWWEPVILAMEYASCATAPTLFHEILDALLSDDSNSEQEGTQETAPLLSSILPREGLLVCLCLPTIGASPDKDRHLRPLCNSILSAYRRLMEVFGVAMDEEDVVMLLEQSFLHIYRLDEVVALESLQRALSDSENPSLVRAAAQMLLTHGWVEPFKDQILSAQHHDAYPHWPLKACMSVLQPTLKSRAGALTTNDLLDRFRDNGTKALWAVAFLGGVAPMGIDVDMQQLEEECVNMDIPYDTEILSVLCEKIKGKAETILDSFKVSSDYINDPSGHYSRFLSDPSLNTRPPLARADAEDPFRLFASTLVDYLGGKSRRECLDGLAQHNFDWQKVARAYLHSYLDLSMQAAFFLSNFYPRRRLIVECMRIQMSVSARVALGKKLSFEGLPKRLDVQALWSKSPHRVGLKLSFFRRPKAQINAAYAIVALVVAAVHIFDNRPTFDHRCGDLNERFQESLPVSVADVSDLVDILPASRTFELTCDRVELLGHMVRHGFFEQALLLLSRSRLELGVVNEDPLSQALRKLFVLARETEGCLPGISQYVSVFLVRLNDWCVEVARVATPLLHTDDDQLREQAQFAFYGNRKIVKTSVIGIDALRVILEDWNDPVINLGVTWFFQIRVEHDDLALIKQALEDISQDYDDPKFDFEGMLLSATSRTDDIVAKNVDKYLLTHTTGRGAYSLWNARKTRGGMTSEFWEELAKSFASAQSPDLDVWRKAITAAAWNCRLSANGIAEINFVLAAAIQSPEERVSSWACVMLGVLLCRHLAAKQDFVKGMLPTLQLNQSNQTEPFSVQFLKEGGDRVLHVLKSLCVSSRSTHLTRCGAFAGLLMFYLLESLLTHEGRGQPTPATSYRAYHRVIDDVEQLDGLGVDDLSLPTVFGMLGASVRLVVSWMQDVIEAAGLLLDTLPDDVLHSIADILRPVLQEEDRFRGEDVPTPVGGLLPILSWSKGDRLSPLLNNPTPQQFCERLTDLGTSMDFLTARQAAIRLMPKIRPEYTTSALQAFVATVRATPDEQYTAISSFSKFSLPRDFAGSNSSILDLLIAELSSKSALRTHFAGVLLVELAGRPDCSEDLQRRVFDVLLSVASDERPRTVKILEGRYFKLGSLRRAFKPMVIQRVLFRSLLGMAVPRRFGTRSGKPLSVQQAFNDTSKRVSVKTFISHPSHRGNPDSHSQSRQRSIFKRRLHDLQLATREMSSTALEDVLASACPAKSMSGTELRSAIVEWLKAHGNLVVLRRKFSDRLSDFVEEEWANWDDFVHDLERGEARLTPLCLVAAAQVIGRTIRCVTDLRRQEYLVEIVPTITSSDENCPTSPLATSEGENHEVTEDSIPDAIVPDSLFDDILIAYQSGAWFALRAEEGLPSLVRFADAVYEGDDKDVDQALEAIRRLPSLAQGKLRERFLGISPSDTHLLLRYVKVSSGLGNVPPPLSKRILAELSKALASPVGEMHGDLVSRLIDRFFSSQSATLPLMDVIDVLNTSMAPTIFFELSLGHCDRRFACYAIRRALQQGLVPSMIDAVRALVNDCDPNVVRLMAMSVADEEAVWFDDIERLIAGDMIIDRDASGLLAKFQKLPRDLYHILARPLLHAARCAIRYINGLDSRVLHAYIDIHATLTGELHPLHQVLDATTISDIVTLNWSDDLTWLAAYDILIEGLDEHGVEGVPPSSHLYQFYERIAGQFDIANYLAGFPTPPASRGFPQWRVCYGYGRVCYAIANYEQAFVALTHAERCSGEFKYSEWRGLCSLKLNQPRVALLDLLRCYCLGHSSQARSSLYKRVIAMPQRSLARVALRSRFLASLTDSQLVNELRQFRSIVRIESGSQKDDPFWKFLRMLSYSCDNALKDLRAKCKDQSHYWRELVKIFDVPNSFVGVNSRFDAWSSLDAAIQDEVTETLLKMSANRVVEPIESVTSFDFNTSRYQTGYARENFFTLARAGRAVERDQVAKALELIQQSFRLLAVPQQVWSRADTVITTIAHHDFTTWTEVNTMLCDLFDALSICWYHGPVSIANPELPESVTSTTVDKPSALLEKVEGSASLFLSGYSPLTAVADGPTKTKVLLHVISFLLIFVGKDRYKKGPYLAYCMDVNDG